MCSSDLERDFWLPIRNSLIVAGVTTLLCIVLGAPCAYAVAQKALRIAGATRQEEDGTGLSLSELALDQGASPDARLTGVDEMRQLLGLIDQLDRREAAVIRMRFGLNDEEPKTLKEIGERLGLTRERVRQIECDALRKLRECLEAS